MTREYLMDQTLIRFAAFLSFLLQIGQKMLIELD